MEWPTIISMKLEILISWFMKRQKICKFLYWRGISFWRGITRVTFWTIWRLSVNFKAIALQANQVSDDWQVLVSRRNIGGEKVAVWCPTWAVEGKYLTRTMKSHFRWLCHRSKLVQLILFGTRLICPLCHLLQVNGLSTLFFFICSIFQNRAPRCSSFFAATEGEDWVLASDTEYFPVKVDPFMQRRAEFQLISSNWWVAAIFQSRPFCRAAT